MIKCQRLVAQVNFLPVNFTCISMLLSLSPNNDVFFFFFFFVCLFFFKFKILYMYVFLK